MPVIEMQVPAFGDTVPPCLVVFGCQVTRGRTTQTKLRCCPAVLPHHPKDIFCGQHFEVFPTLIVLNNEWFQRSFENKGTKLPKYPDRQMNE